MSCLTAPALSYIGFVICRDDDSNWPAEPCPPLTTSLRLLGLLMMASIPIQRLPITERFPHRARYHVEMAPSRAAAQAGRDRIVCFLMSDMPKGIVVQPSRHFGFDEGVSGDFSQINYLKRLEDILRDIAATGALVHRTFYDAINAATQRLMADRQALAAAYPQGGHTARWSSTWLFEMPSYDPTVGSFQNGQWVTRGDEGGGDMNVQGAVDAQGDIDAEGDVDVEGDVDAEGDTDMDEY